MTRGEKHALRNKITVRWNTITSGQMFNPLFGHRAKALTELEHILIQAGLLAERGEKPSERAMRLSERAMKMFEECPPRAARRKGGAS